jgi:3-hydroxyacyl-CoA dehydrogenase/enoyl-CoA hydratase/carnithine racemase
MPAEVVTHALPHDVALPSGAGTMVLITLDNGADHRRPNSFGQAGLTELDAAVAAALARDDVAAIGITGKPYSFCAGADVTAMPYLTDREQALAIARLGHRVYSRISTADKPVFAFVNALALGGGLELALHCRYRTVATNAPAVGLPEVSLGLVPGWGGTYLLPNLTGVEQALTVMLANPLQNNRLLRGPQVLELGIADAAFEPADFLERSIEWAAGVVSGAVTVDRPPVDRGPVTWGGVVGGARALLSARTHGACVAGERLLDLVESARTADPVSAYAGEDDALADLLMSPEFRAGIYAFDLVQRRAKRPAGVPSVEPRPIGKVGVVGGGLMGRQLALLFARRLEVPVTVIDVDEAKVGQALAGIRADVENTVARKRMQPATAQRIAAMLSGSTDTASLADADLVIEAVVEDPQVKASVFAELERRVQPECLLVTNTSALSVAEMGASLAHPERVVGLHFFNPVAVLPLVEVVRTDRTDDETLATTFAVAKGLRKSAVLVHDAPGFVVNRVLTRLMGAVLGPVDDGVDVSVADSALAELGLPMSPLELVELVGPGVALHVAETLHRHWPDRFGVSRLLTAMVEHGVGGVWEKRDRNDPRAALAPPRLREDIRPLLTDIAGQANGPGVDAPTIRAQALEAVTDEIGRLLDEGVVGDVRDIDLCLILGAGWPFWLGGITPYLDRTGISERIRGRRFLPPGAASLPAAGSRR